MCSRISGLSASAFGVGTIRFNLASFFELSRESSKKDARLKRIVPTPKAEALRPEILEHIRDTEKRLIQGIDQEDVKICRKVLVQMIQNLAENKTENKEEDENDE